MENISHDILLKILTILCYFLTKLDNLFPEFNAVIMLLSHKFYQQINGSKSVYTLRKQPFSPYTQVIINGKIYVGL